MKSYTMRKMEDTLHKQLKILAAEKGISIQKAILEALERYIEEQKIKKGGENGDNKRHKNHED